MRSRFKGLVVLALGVSLMAGCGRYSFSNIRSLKAFKDAVDMYQRSDYVGAARAFEQSIQFNPEFGFSYFYLGNSYDKQYKAAQKGEPDNDALLHKAVANYRKAIEKLATSPEPQAPQFRKLSFEYLIAAYGSDRLNDFAQAESVAKELIALEPEESGNYQALGRLYEDQGRFEDAEAMFQKGAEVRPNEPLGYQLLAAYYNRQGQFDKTVAAFQKRAELEPTNPEAWHTMGTFYYDKVLRDTRLTSAVAKDYLNAGLQAEDKALGLNGKYYEALSYKSMLLSLQANKEPNVARQKQLLAEASSIRDKALVVQKEQEAGAAAAAAAAKKEE